MEIPTNELQCLPFQAKPKCRKCTSTDIIRGWCIGRKFTNCETLDSQCQSTRSANIPDFEHHHMHCRNCHFEWIERLPKATTKKVKR